MALTQSLKIPGNVRTKTSVYVADLTSRLLHTFGTSRPTFPLSPIPAPPNPHPISPSTGMPHTRKTFVGNDFVRGVSGGERKRVSLSEMLTTNAALICWDNCQYTLSSLFPLLPPPLFPHSFACANSGFLTPPAIRGLDSAVALHYLKALHELSRSTGMSNIVSIYQASQEMYDKCFDRVVVIFEGEMVFSVSALRKLSSAKRGRG